MTEKLDFRPERVDIYVAAGDSVSFTIRMRDPTALPGPTWSAQVRDLAGANVQDFTITQLADGALVVLPPEATRELADLSSGQVAGTVGSSAFREVWRGKYDVQVVYGGGLVRTLINGMFSVSDDVTR
jgi:hypothetical protein